MKMYLVNHNYDKAKGVRLWLVSKIKAVAWCL